jgi:hypothetical protein
MRIRTDVRFRGGITRSITRSESATAIGTKRRHLSTCDERSSADCQMCAASFRHGFVHFVWRLERRFLHSTARSFALQGDDPLTRSCAQVDPNAHSPDC